VSTTGPFADPQQGPIGDTLAPGGRQIRMRAFHERVPLAGAVLGTTPSKDESWITVTLDGLGRATRTERPLGSDYAGRSLIVDRQYDGMGRALFVSDAYASSEPGPAYGTTYQYRGDSEIQCVARGRGVQQDFSTTSPSAARYVTCRTEGFASRLRYVISRGPEELDPTSTAYNAYDITLGGALHTFSEIRVAASGAQVTRMDHAFDRLGRHVGLTRYATPGTSGAPTVTWTSDLDSIGRVLRSREPGAAQRSFTYDRAGNLVEARWIDGSVTHAVASQFDGLGRLRRTATLTSNASNLLVEDAQSAVVYTYDVGSGLPFHRDTQYAIGRMTSATSAAQSVYLGYDSLGHRSFNAWVDRNGVRVEQTLANRVDGAPRTLAYALPDDNYAPEIATYLYDSAQRPSKVRFQDDARPSGIDLFTANVRDARGRLRDITYGNGVNEKYTYRDADRNEPMVKLLAVNGGSAYETYDYDDTLRLRNRSEHATFGTKRVETSSYTYDLAGRLATATVINDATGALVLKDSYSYDGLGNLNALTDSVWTRGFTTVADTVDADRLCKIVGAGITASTGCNVQYDALGNVTSSPTAASSLRQIRYDGRGRPRDVSVTGWYGPYATYQYDPFGGVAQLDVVGFTTDARQDVRYGTGVESSLFRGASTPTFERRVPLPSGGAFIKRGPGSTATLLYTLIDMHGTRLVTDASGKVTQESVYRPYGDQRLRTGAVRDLSTTKYGFNGGDTLDDFAMEQIGARLYEPRFGRFLQRDPIVANATASIAHPYMFAGGNPISRRDPTGMCSEGEQGCVQWLPVLPGLVDLFTGDWSLGGDDRSKPDTSFHPTLMRPRVATNTMWTFPVEQAPYVPLSNLKVTQDGMITTNECDPTGCWAYIKTPEGASVTFTSAEVIEVHPEPKIWQPTTKDLLKVYAIAAGALFPASDAAALVEALVGAGSFSTAAEVGTMASATAAADEVAINNTLAIAWARGAQSVSIGPVSLVRSGEVLSLVAHADVNGIGGVSLGEIGAMVEGSEASYIELIACDTGLCMSAQSIANITNKFVKAPLGEVSATLGPPEYYGTPLVSLDGGNTFLPPGQGWKWFFPEY